MAGFGVGHAGIRSLTFKQGIEILRKRDQKKLENNTWLVRVDDDTLAVRLHATNIVTIHKNGRYTLNSGGWRTVTTKDRLNRYSPARISQENNIWYIGDGVLVSRNGKPITRLKKPVDVQKQKRLLDKMVRQYIAGFAKDVVKNGLKKPTGADCWHCWVALVGMLYDVPSKTHDLQHLLNHMKEPYYVPSLLMNACYQNTPDNALFLWGMIEAQAKNKETPTLKYVLRSYFKKLKPQLLDLMVK